MSTIKYPHDALTAKTRALRLFFTSVLALVLFVATPLAGSQIPAANAQTTTETGPEDQEPAASSINATQTITQANETDLVDDDDLDEQNDFSPANLSTLSISSTATTEVRPDQLSVTVGVETNDTTAQDAVSQNANLTAQVIAALRGLGIGVFISSDRQEEIRDTLIGGAIANARQRANIAAEALGMTVSGVQSATINPLDFPVFSVDLQEGAAAADTVSAPTQILPGEQEVSTTVSVVFYISAEGPADS